MKKALVCAAVTAAALTVMLSFSAFAETHITHVKFYAEVDGDEEVSETVQDLDFYAESGEYELASWEVSTASSTGKNTATYKLTFYANDGYTFGSSSSSITVTGVGIDSVSSKTIKDDGDTLEVKVKAYPYVQLPAPELTSDFDSDTITFECDVSGVYFEYYLVYQTYSGNSKTVHKSNQTSTSVSVTSYNKEYTGSNEDYDDMQVTGFWVRTYAFKSSSNPNVVPSKWTGYGDEPDASLDDYETWSDWTGSSSKTVTSSGTGSSVTESSGPSGTVYGTTGWQGSGNDWYYYRNGSVVTGWFQDTDGSWYYLDPSNGGLMFTGGWKQLDGYWYYMNPNHDGTYGRMMDDPVITVDGVQYHLNQSHDGTYGRWLGY